MKMLKASSKVGRFLLFCLAGIVLVPVIFGLLVSSPVTENIGAGKDIFKNLMVPLLLFRFMIYISIFIFYEPITIHFTSRLKFSKSDTEYALTKRHILVFWIIGFEFVVTASLIVLMV